MHAILQGGNTNSTRSSGSPVANDFAFRLTTVDKSEYKESVELRKKKYLTFSYELAFVDDYDTKSRVRYNIYEDEIEFIKDNSIYYLVKEVGRRIRFVETKELYRVFKLDEEPNFFKVHVEDKHSLLAKQRVRYIEPRKALSGYDRAKPANYRRMKDELYLALENRNLIKLSRDKKEFLEVFGNKSETMNTFMRQNKLNFRKIEDLKKIIQYFNIL